MKKFTLDKLLVISIGDWDLVETSESLILPDYRNIYPGQYHYLYLKWINKLTGAQVTVEGYPERQLYTKFNHHPQEYFMIRTSDTVQEIDEFATLVARIADIVTDIRGQIGLNKSDPVFKGHSMSTKEQRDWLNSLPIDPTPTPLTTDELESKGETHIMTPEQESKIIEICNDLHDHKNPYNYDPTGLTHILIGFINELLQNQNIKAYREGYIDGFNSGFKVGDST